MTSPLSPLHEWRGEMKFFLPKQRSGKWGFRKGQTKHETPTPTPTKRPGQTRNAHTKTHQKARPNTKRPHQNPPKGLTFTRLQASPPHEMRKGRAAKPRAPFAFRGAWGDLSPHTKKRNTQLVTRDRMYSRVMAAMAPVEISLGHTAVHSPSLEQPPKCSF